MKKNKNRMRDRDHSNAERRKMRPKQNADLGIADEKHIGTHSSGHEKGK